MPINAHFRVLEVIVTDTYPTNYMGQIKMDLFCFDSSTAIYLLCRLLCIKYNWDFALCERHHFKKRKRLLFFETRVSVGCTMASLLVLHSIYFHLLMSDTD